MKRCVESIEKVGRRRQKYVQIFAGKSVCEVRKGPASNIDESTEMVRSAPDDGCLRPEYAWLYVLFLTKLCLCWYYT